MIPVRMWHHFDFLSKKDDLLAKWIQFVNRADWKPSSNSVICSKHFDDKFICNGQRKILNWSLNPIPTIHTTNALKRPLTLKNPLELRKPPKIRVYQEDQSSILIKRMLSKIFQICQKKIVHPVTCATKQMITSFIITSFLRTNFQL